jgi:hypothetical protein
MGRARLVRGANGAAHHNRALIANQTQELREPGHVPTPPRHQTGFARGQSSPKDWPHLFSGRPFCCWPSAAKKGYRLRVRNWAYSCRASWRTARQFLIHNVTSPPSISALRKAICPFQTWRAPCLGTPGQLPPPEGQEHGRTIPLADIVRGLRTGGMSPIRAAFQSIGHLSSRGMHRQPHSVI